MGDVKVNETIPVADALELVVKRAADQVAPPAPVIKPGFVCKACGTVLADRDGNAASGKPEDACPGAGPHVAVLVDLATAVIGDGMKVVRAVHLE